VNIKNKLELENRDTNYAINLKFPGVHLQEFFRKFNNKHKFGIFLLAYSNSSLFEIRKQFKQNISTISYHLNKLTDIVKITPNGTKVINRLKNEIKTLNLPNSQ